MALVFIAIDPETDTDHCPAVFVDDETGDLIFQGWTVTDPKMLADVAKHSPIADSESAVGLPGRMRTIILEALSRFHYFSGDGDIVEDELVCDLAVIRTCAAAFEAVWERAVPHAEYRLA
jgi:hypothetical protein